MEREAGVAASGGATSERLQVLLARAAQEQLTEQRQVSAVLADLHELVSGIGRRLDAVRDDLSALTTRVDALAGRIEASRVEDSRIEDSRIEDSRVEQLVTASEERLREHVDEAVLALAEVLLRRGRPAPAPVDDEPGCSKDDASD